MLYSNLQESRTGSWSSAGILHSIGPRAILATLLLASSPKSIPADPPARNVTIGTFDVPEERCQVGLSFPSRHQRVNLVCGRRAESRDAAPISNSSPALWLLLDDGNAAVQVPGSLIGGSCSLDCSFILTVEFEFTGSPVAVVVRYKDEFHALPISRENLEKATSPQ